MALRVVIAEDSPLIRAGLKRLLEELGVVVTGEAGDVPGLMSAVASGRPDAVILDVRMPPSQTDEGIVAAQDLRMRFPEVAVLLLSQHMGSPTALDLIERSGGGVGYLLKDRVADAEALIEALQRLVDGGTVLDPQLARRLVDTRRQAAMLASSTPREHQVLALMAEGLTNAAIARKLDISVKTVELHVGRVLTLLGLPAELDVNRRVLAVVAYLRANGTLPG